MATTAVRKTIADLHGLPDDGRIYELIDGEIHVSAAPGEPHFWVSRRLIRLLLPYDEDLRLGWLYWAPIEVHLPNGDAVQPDVIFYGRDRPPRRPGPHLEGVPDLIAEVASPSTRQLDQGKKRASYETAGVREYWLADPERREFRVLTLTDGRYQPIPQGGSKVSSLVLPGLEVDVDALFADLP
jgi:Uma2 family endonuclease